MKFNPKTERVVAAWPETANGPGWANGFVNVLIGVNGTDAHRVEVVQRKDLPAEMLTLFGPCLAASGALREAAQRYAFNKGRGRGVRR